jgi:hypothetical protein
MARVLAFHRARAGQPGRSLALAAPSNMQQVPALHSEFELATVALVQLSRSQEARTIDKAVQGRLTHVRPCSATFGSA